MRKIIKFSQGEYNWTIEMEVAEFPSVLKKGECRECSIVNLDKTEKDLVFAERRIERDGEDFYYICYKHSRHILRPVSDWGLGSRNLVVHNPQVLEEIKKELSKHKPD